METTIGFFSKNSVSHVKITALIDSCEKFVTKARFDLYSITTDQGSNFSKAFKNLGCTVKNPIIKINGKTLLYFQMCSCSEIN